MTEKESMIFIEHISNSIRDIEFFMNKVSKESIFDNKEKQSAVIRQIEIIGEAVKNILDSLKDKYQDIPWKDIAGMRDKLIHHYFGVNLNTVWMAVKEDFLYLKEKILKIRENLENKNNKEKL